MAFCGKCGTKLGDGDGFCRSCGAPAHNDSAHSNNVHDTIHDAADKARDAARQAAEKAADTARNAASGTADAARQAAEKAADAARKAAAGAADAARKAADAARQAWQGDDVSRNKGLAILSYIPLINLIPYFAEKESPFVRFHAIQGMYLLILELIVSAASNIFRGMRWGMHGAWWFFGGGWIFLLLEIACGVFIVALIVTGIVNASSGYERELPVVRNMKRWGWFK